MGLLDMFKSPDINAGVVTFQNTPGAVLLDVRTTQEYAYRRIPRSVNLPLQDLSRISDLVPDPATPLFVYCFSGGRSSQAVKQLKSMGYTAVTNIGGISDYRGPFACE